MTLPLTTASEGMASHTALPNLRRMFNLIVIVALPVLTIICLLWYGMNSNSDDIPPLLRQLIPAGHCTCHTSTVFECTTCLNPSPPVADHKVPANWEFNYSLHGQSRDLYDDQCASAFPGLLTDPLRAASFWQSQSQNITRTLLDAIPILPSMAYAGIHKGNLYIYSTKSAREDHRRKILATLSSIHRALVAAPERFTNVLDIDFVFSIEDMAEDVNGEGTPIWVLTRKASEESLWLMPDFGLWAWRNQVPDGSSPVSELGPYDQAVERATMVEREMQMAGQEKIPKLIWRGNLAFAPKLRRAMMDASRGKEWSDVKELKWNVKGHYLPMEDHCKYAFIAHAEGRSYSASLKYRQACHSVLLIHKLQYIQHHHYLLASSGPQQNYVEVERDFSDLEEKMSDLLAHPDKAKRIADNSVRVFRERYLTGAAEACYWRGLWGAYAGVYDGGGFAGGKRGLRYETFVLLDSTEMMDFKAS